MPVSLTHQDWTRVVQDLNKIEMLTEEEVQAIATKLNEHVGLPFVSDKREQIVLVKIVRKVDRFLYSQLPNEYYELIRMTQDGITDEEADVMKKRLGSLINDHINLPFLSEKVEQGVFEFVIGLVVDAMRKGQKLVA